MNFATSLSRAPGFALGLAALALTAALAGCAEPAPPQVIAPPPPQVAPTVSLSPRLIEQASAYRAYIARTGAITPAFTDGESVAQSLKTGAAYEPGQLLRGAIAYG